MDISMYERVKIINEYYTYLEYKDNRREALGKISTLSKELIFEDIHDFSHRFFETATLIRKNLRVFMAACEHIDVITSIVDYFIHFAVSFKLDASAIHNNNEKIILIMLTINNIYKEHGIQLFLETAIIKKSQLQMYNNYKENIRPSIKLILLEDSDLYAVINCLKIRNVLFHIDKIWVQESIKHTFVWYLKKYFGYLHINFYTFRSRQELLIHSTSDYSVHIVSIWSEDVIAAKNLAEYLNQDVLFINSYMDFCPGIVLPYTDIYIKSSLYESFNLQEIEDEHICANPINPTYKGLIYDLFYDGMWQKPKKNTYWIHKEILLANATRADIMECIDSATEGFQIWSTMSNDSRMQLLFKFASTLECNGKFSLTKIILYWAKLPYIYGSLIHYFQTERFEVIKSRKPQGIVILKEKDEITLFRELTQSLIIGNSVIVICNPDLCTLAPYCNMFKISGIPPGVINLLSSKNTDFRYDTINNSTASEIYEDNADFRYDTINNSTASEIYEDNTDFRYDTINNSTASEIYEALTIVKHIIISRK